MNGKPVVAAVDLNVLLVFNIAFDSGVFRSEGQRIQLAGLYQLLCYTGARPAELVDSEISESLPKLTTFRTVFYFTPAKKILFCAVSTIISLALRDQAFEASSLKHAAAVLGLKVQGSVQSMALRWKQSMLKIPVFRNFNGTELSPDQPMPYHKLRDDLHRQSLNAGFEVPWTPRFFRRGAANAANGNAPDSVRDQMMRHDPKFATFHGAYLNEKVNFDLQNTFLEETTESQLYKLFTHVSLTRDPRATRDMVPQEVWDNLPPDPEIQELVLQREKLKAGRYRIQGNEHEVKIRQLTEKIRNKEDRRDKTVAKAYRSYHFYNRSTWETERQALGVEEDEYVKPVINLKIPERARLADILCY
ncbi:FluG domain-containing protein [Colletotrichum kahawae]|uniref:FluG domain-containing protein n=1 Tax=Colletotrichum kahawae TaxID=34407 RepID=A0AAE0CZ06_COLKA|nr:FluG domain-containing protein [Colletotrichum kahawae]